MCACVNGRTIHSIRFQRVNDAMNTCLCCDCALHTLQELLRLSLQALSYGGMWLAFRNVRDLPGNTLRVLAVGLGWSFAQSITHYAPALWTGARGTEFSWEYLEMGVNANIDLVRGASGMACPAMPCHFSSLRLQRCESGSHGLLFFSFFRCNVMFARAMHIRTRYSVPCWMRLWRHR